VRLHVVPAWNQPQSYYYWFRSQYINIKFDVFWSIEIHRVKRVEQPGGGKLNAVIGTVPS